MHVEGCGEYVMVGCDQDKSLIGYPWCAPILGHHPMCKHFSPLSYADTCWKPECIALGRHHYTNCEHISILEWEWTQAPERGICCTDDEKHEYCANGTCCSCCICQDCNKGHGSGCNGDCCKYDPEDLNFIGELLHLLLDQLEKIRFNTTQILMEVSGMGEFFQSLIWLLDDILAYTILGYRLQDDILEENIAQKGLLHLILNELRAIANRAVDPPDIELNPLLELMEQILQAIKDIRIEITQYITNEEAPERLSWWQRILDMILTVLEAIINVFATFIEWIGNLLMWILEELIMAIVRGIINITSGMISWLGENLTAFFGLFRANSPVTRWYRDDEDWWSWLPNQEIYIYIPNKVRITA
jgi:hypothetical protein